MFRTLSSRLKPHEILVAMMMAGKQKTGFKIISRSSTNQIPPRVPCSSRQHFVHNVSHTFPTWQSEWVSDWHTHRYESSFPKQKSVTYFAPCFSHQLLLVLQPRWFRPSPEGKTTTLYCTEFVSVVFVTTQVVQPQPIKPNPHPCHDKPTPKTACVLLRTGVDSKHAQKSIFLRSRSHDGSTTSGHRLYERRPHGLMSRACTEYLVPTL